MPDVPLYDRLGGAATLEALVAAFYAGVAEDPVLRPLYPEDDLAGAEERLAAFLVQLTGGPRRYAALRGDPKLRLRHLAFPISGREAAAWMTQMDRALAEAVVPEGSRAELRAYFARTAEFLINRGGLALGGTRRERPAAGGGPEA